MGITSKMSECSVVARSDNSKIGKCAATYAPIQTCPATCPFKDNGCYAQSGPSALHFNRISKNAEGKTPLELARIEASYIAKLNGKLPLRMHVSGDCQDIASAMTLAVAAKKYTAKHGQPVWCYTHNWRAIPRKAWGTISVIASCETVEDVVIAEKRGYRTAMVSDLPREELKVVTNECGSYRGLTCTTCQLCIQGKSLTGTVVFRPHGARKRRVSEMLASK